MSCTQTCNQGRECTCYRSQFDQLGERISNKLTSDTYTESLIQALLIALVLALPVIILFWRM